HVRGAGISQPQLKHIGAGDRYVACVRYDARNTDGKYLGSKDGAAIYVGGKLDRFFDTPSGVRELCKEVAYVPFPELERLPANGGKGDKPPAAGGPRGSFRNT